MTQKFNNGQLRQGYNSMYRLMAKYAIGGQEVAMFQAMQAACEKWNLDPMAVAAAVSETEPKKGFCLEIIAEKMIADSDFSPTRAALNAVTAMFAR